MGDALALRPSLTAASVPSRSACLPPCRRCTVGVVAGPGTVAEVQEDGNEGAAPGSRIARVGSRRGV